MADQFNILATRNPAHRASAQVKRKPLSRAPI